MRLKWLQENDPAALLQMLRAGQSMTIEVHPLTQHLTRSTLQAIQMEGELTVDQKMDRDKALERVTAIVAPAVEESAVSLLERGATATLLQEWQNAIATHHGETIE